MYLLVKFSENKFYSVNLSCSLIVTIVQAIEAVRRIFSANGAKVNSNPTFILQSGETGSQNSKMAVSKLEVHTRDSGKILMAISPFSL